MSAQLRHAVDDAARRRRLDEHGRHTPATVLAVRPTGRLTGSTPLLEVDLQVERADGRREWLTIVEAVPLVRSARTSPGATVELVIGARPEDGAMIDWSV